MNSLKIIKGTCALTRLCDSCSHGVVMRGAQQEEIVYCREAARNVEIRVVECNRYQSRVLREVGEDLLEEYLLS